MPPLICRHLRRGTPSNPPSRASSLLKKPPGEGTGAYRPSKSGVIPVERVPSRGALGVFQQAARGIHAPFGFGACHWAMFALLLGEVCGRLSSLNLAPEQHGYSMATRIIGHDRGGLGAGRQAAPNAGVIPGLRCCTLRLLHSGHVAEREGSAGLESAADRSRNPHGHFRQPLPLHRLPADCAGYRKSRQVMGVVLTRFA